MRFAWDGFRVPVVYVIRPVGLVIAHRVTSTVRSAPYFGLFSFFRTGVVVVAYSGCFSLMVYSHRLVAAGGDVT